MSNIAEQRSGYLGNKEKVARIINSVLEKVSKAEEVSREAIYKELLDVQSIIDEMRQQVGSLKASDISGKHIPGATDELDAVVAATAEATSTIMDACDIIQEKASDAGESSDAIVAEVMKIYEACSFQDITGQRITSVVKTLRKIEDKVDNLIATMSERIPILRDEAEDDDDERQGDEKFLNGPQLPENAISQEDIDKLLAEFDD
ncbi:MAG: protein phosphatase CheZ [Alphaproteobacteria bacterium]|nr:protein phosphatase CheZ [Alphaproteobacteria bacterium]